MEHFYSCKYIICYNMLYCFEYPVSTTFLSECKKFKKIIQGIRTIDEDGLVWFGLQHINPNELFNIDNIFAGGNIFL